jgi:hypothetical protein
MDQLIDPRTYAFIEQIHSASVKLVFEFAGAGSLALFWLHSVPGSSRTVIEATDRYAAASLAELIGRVPEKYVAAETAQAMAARAYRRAMRLDGGANRCVGIGCTATIATDRAKRGDHGCWIAVQDRNEAQLYGLVLRKGARDRFGEESAVSKLILTALGRSSGIDARLPLDLLDGEQIETHTIPAIDPIARLLDGDAQYVIIAADGQIDQEAPPPKALLSGSFNPLHAGHERLAQAAALVLGHPVAFELPVLNADKPPLNYATIERRVEQFAFRAPVVLTRAPLFVDKADLFPGSVFVVGFDTAARLVDRRYYGDTAARDAAFARIRANNCRFLVAGRLRDEVFSTLRDLPIPSGFADLFLELPEEVFRVDLSSSEIRAAISAA